jgi:hypothetical protein
MVMLDMFNLPNIAVGVLSLVSFVFWLVMLGLHLYFFFMARREYKRLGGLRRAKSEAKQAAKSLSNTSDITMPE